MQIVLSGNRVIAHGEDCFLCMGGTVVCNSTGKAYPNATIAEVEAIPSDIDSVGYEYRAGAFVPCAPYGKTDSGRVMLACDECSSPRSSDLTSKNGGLHIPGELTGGKVPADIRELLGLADGADVATAFAALKSYIDAGIRVATGTYTGTGTAGRDYPTAITFDFIPHVVVVWESGRGLCPWANYDPGYSSPMSIGWDNSFLWVSGMDGTNICGDKLKFVASEKTLSWYLFYASNTESISPLQLNQKGLVYSYFAIGSNGSYSGGSLNYSATANDDGGTTVNLY